MSSVQVLTTSSAAAVIRQVSGNPGVLLAVNTAAPSTVANTTTETQLGPGVTLASGSLKVGTVVRMMRYGYFTTTLTAPSFVGNTRLNGSTILTTGTISALANISQALAWWSETLLTIVTTGKTGSAYAHGRVSFSTSANAALMVNPFSATAVPMDTTADILLADTVKWGTASATNSITKMAQYAEMFG